MRTCSGLAEQCSGRLFWWISGQGFALSENCGGEKPSVSNHYPCPSGFIPMRAARCLWKMPPPRWELPLIGGKVTGSPSKPLVEQFRLWACPITPKADGNIGFRAPRASRWIFSSTNCRHHHQRRPQGKPQPSPCHPIPAGSRLHWPSPGRHHDQRKMSTPVITHMLPAAGPWLGR